MYLIAVARLLKFIPFGDSKERRPDFDDYNFGDNHGEDDDNFERYDMMIAQQCL